MPTTTDRDLDATIEEEIFGWRLAHVGPDYDGQNECEVLTSNGQLPKDFLLPPRGVLHRGYFCRHFSDDWQQSLWLARYVGLKTYACEIPDNPADLAAECLKLWRE
jgi:hypothetical protein